jgi:hypothetical protein
MANNSDRVLESLRAKVEDVREAADGTRWGMVYLDNAIGGMSVTSFRSCLAQLSKQGLYRVVDGYAFGEVKL